MPIPTRVRSQNVDRFNHDEDADGYDFNVRNEANPIRAGYAELLSWVVRESRVSPQHRVLELGSGTGNLTHQLPPCAALTAVDISVQMTTIAKDKVADHVEFVCDDVLAYVSQNQRLKFDRVISTYTLHHLNNAEKQVFFEAAYCTLEHHKGLLVVGDLMFENAVSKERILAQYRCQGAAELADEIEDEYFWDVRSACEGLQRAGFAEPAARRFSELSWGLVAKVP